MTTRYTTLVGILALLVLFALGVTLRPWVVAQQVPPGRTEGVPARDSVAVFPFDAPADLHDGVKFHLTGWLREIPVGLLTDTSLRVARPQIVQALRKPLDPLRAGQQLGVASILTGSVKVEDDGARLLLIVELLDTQNGLLMWTRTWELDDIFRKNELLPQVRDEIIEGVKKRFERESAQRQVRK